MKKVFAALLSLMILAGAMTGCGQSTSASQSNSAVQSQSTVKKDPVTIKIWHEGEEGIVKELQAELDKLAPDVVVKIERKEKLTDSLKLVGNDPNSAPDMYLFAHDKIGVMAQMGILSPITDFISKNDMADLIPMTVNAATYKDQIYQLPIYFETQMFMYNKKLMKNPPATTDDLLAYMKENTKNGTYGFVEQHSTAYYAASWLHAFGGYIINDKAEPGLDLKATQDAVTYHKQFVKYMPVDGEYQHHDDPVQGRKGTFHHWRPLAGPHDEIRGNRPWNCADADGQRDRKTAYTVFRRAGGQRAENGGREQERGHYRRAETTPEARYRNCACKISELRSCKSKMLRQRRG